MKTGPINKRCPRCKRVRGLEYFGVVQGRPGCWCKDCRREALRQDGIENKAAIREKTRAYRKAHPEARLRAQRKYRQKYREVIRVKNREYARARYRANPDIFRGKSREKLYGLTQIQHEDLERRQGGLCAICGNSALAGKVLVVDHDHQTGKVRGLLCKPCNLALGLFKDSPDRLLEAALYLESRRD